MLKASRMARKGLTADYIYEVADGETAVGTINDTRSSMELGGRGYTVFRKGILGPEYQLKCGDTIVATATQKPMFNHYTLAHDGREWTFKAIGLLATKFGLYQGEDQIGTVASGPWLNRGKGITADLPEELPLELRMFLLLLAINSWSQQAS